MSAIAKHRLAIHIFRRDLRIQDNTALINALQNSEKVIPCFIFDDRQIKDNPFYSNNAMQFMINSLEDLGEELANSGGRLFIFSGIAHTIFESLIKKYSVDAVYANRDYTPFSSERDHAIGVVCKKFGIDFKLFGDTLLNEPEQVLKADNKPYTVFTPYCRKARLLDVGVPKRNSFRNYYTEPFPEELSGNFRKKIFIHANRQIHLKGGRNEAIALMNKLSDLNNYNTSRDIPSISGTSFLSPHIKFGTVSIREVFHRIVSVLGINHSLIRELYWRDFFTQIAFHFPHVFGHAFHKQYDKIEWENDERKYIIWCSGRTGFPIIDAGMRQLNATGWMHNRVRMIVAGFLVKDLHIDWRMGEKYFAQKLIDYDPAVNNGNWQWAASTGGDAQPYFRIFNPWLQQKKFDTECRYIKTWVQELTLLTSKQIHDLYRYHPENLNYPKPVVNHKLSSGAVKEMYRLIEKE